MRAEDSVFVDVDVNPSTGRGTKVQQGRWDKKDRKSEMELISRLD